MSIDGFNFDLPPVSKTSGDFIDIPDAPIPQEEAEDIPYSFVDDNGAEESVDNDPESARGILSSNGDVYDPSIHLFPQKETRTGNWRKRRKADSDKNDKQNNVPYLQEAQRLATLYGLVHAVPFGEGGSIEKATDLIPMRDAFAAYMQANGLTEVPPQLAVIVTCLSYSSSVASRPINEEKMSRLKGWMMSGVNWVRIKLFGWKPPRRVEPARAEARQVPTMDLNPHSASNSAPTTEGNH